MQYVCAPEMAIDCGHLFVAGFSMIKITARKGTEFKPPLTHFTYKLLIGYPAWFLLNYPAADPAVWLLTFRRLPAVSAGPLQIKQPLMRNA